MKVREIAYPSDNFSHYIFYTINLLVKIRVQLQLGKVLIGHHAKLHKALSVSSLSSVSSGDSSPRISRRLSVNPVRLPVL